MTALTANSLAALSVSHFFGGTITAQPSRRIGMKAFGLNRIAAGFADAAGWGGIHLGSGQPQRVGGELFSPIVREISFVQRLLRRVPGAIKIAAHTEYFDKLANIYNGEVKR